MPSIGQMLIESKGQPITHNGKTFVLADKFPVEAGDVLIASIEKADSDRRQGFSIDVTGHCEIKGKVFKQDKGVLMLFWADTADNPAKIKIFTKTEFVWIKNMWESVDHKGKKYRDHGHNGAAMIVEEIENGRRYHCNDGAPDDDFDDIVFTITKESLKREW